VRCAVHPRPDLRRGIARVGVVSADRLVDLNAFPPSERRQATLIYRALAADTWRFDASDLMPENIGADLLFRSMMRYAAKGPAALDGILARLDAAWPDG
jgi:hypothetical protein